jgi:uncharacterized iron-regulated membrane protein
MKNRRLWFLVHGWLSLPIWVLLCFIFLTGTLSVVSHELTWLANPAARASNPDDLPAKPLPELVAAAQAAVPGAHVHQVLVYEPYLVTRVGVSSKQVPYALVYVNPYTGKVQEINQGLNFIDFMRSLHSWLLFPWQSGYSIGYYLVSAMSLVVLGALITGLVIYKKFWRAFTQPTLRTDSGGRAFLGDLHRLAGAWSLWFLLVMGLTGLWYLSQAILWHNATDVWQHPEPMAAGALPLTEGDAPQPIGLGQALAAAKTALPSLEPAWVALPEHNRDYYSIAGSGEAPLFDQYAYRAFVDPWSGELVEVRQPASMNVWQAISHLADPLHFGSFGGLWTKAIWFLFGLVLSGMSITGFLIWGKRTAQGVRESAPARGVRWREEQA